MEYIRNIEGQVGGGARPPFPTPHPPPHYYYYLMIILWLHFGGEVGRAPHPPPAPLYSLYIPYIFPKYVPYIFPCVFLNLWSQQKTNPYRKTTFIFFPDFMPFISD